MKRLRLITAFAALAVMAIGVQAVNAACPSSMTLYYEHGWYTCNHTGTTDGACDYTCRFYRFYYA